jgi:hypothetical protein
MGGDCHDFLGDGAEEELAELFFV